jgi:hypothetical protein
MFDGWELEEKLNHVRRILGQAPQVDAPGEMACAAAIPGRDAGRWAWLLDKAAVAAQTCGAVLLGWLLIASRHDLLVPGLSAIALGLIASFVRRACPA